MSAAGATLRSRLEILPRYRLITSAEGCPLLAPVSCSWSGDGESCPYAAKILAERALLELREKLARPP
jgi:hypothetical protein